MSSKNGIAGKRVQREERKKLLSIYSFFSQSKFVMVAMVVVVDALR